MRKTMLCVSNEQNSLRKKIARWLHSDFTSLKQWNWDYVLNNKFIAFIQCMMLEFLMRVCIVSLQCIVLALLFINDILYNNVLIFNLQSQRWFLCTRDAHDCNVENCILLLNDCHSSSKEICNERKMYMMKK